MASTLAFETFVALTRTSLSGPAVLNDFYFELISMEILLIKILDSLFCLAVPLKSNECKMSLVRNAQNGSKFLKRVSDVTLISNVVSAIPRDENLIGDRLLHSKI
jgi:hypothetical protein